MSASFKAALVQITSGREVAGNTRVVAEQAAAAKALGADFVMFPETANLMEIKRRPLFEKTAADGGDAGLKAFRDVAKDNKIWLLIGSMVTRHPSQEDKVVNRSVLISPSGEVAATYDKIHLFDADLGGDERYRESKNYAPGGEAVIAETPWGKLGLTVCYDLRFPALYRTLAKTGATMLTVPSAFTRATGRAHWEVLLRARAIECGCYVFAPAQCGEHENGRKTYGHSMIIDPWGEVLAEAGDAPEIITADIDVVRVYEARHRMPSLNHDRDFVL